MKYLNCFLFSVNPESPVPSIRRSLSTIFNARATDDNSTQGGFEPVAGTSAGGLVGEPQPSTSAAGAVLSPERSVDLDMSGIDSQPESQEDTTVVRKSKTVRPKRKRGGKK